MVAGHEQTECVALCKRYPVSFSLFFIIIILFNVLFSLSLSLSLKKKRRFRVLEAFRWGVPGLPAVKIAMDRDWLTFTGNSYTIDYILPHGL